MLQTRNADATAAVRGAAIWVGDAIRFSLRGTLEGNGVVAVARW